MSKHTRGPWKVDQMRALRVASSDDTTVATTGCDDSQRDAWEANARLIAAAPELLEALRYFVGRARMSGEHWASPGIHIPEAMRLRQEADAIEARDKAIRFARAAIAKAEGK